MKRKIIASAAIISLVFVFTAMQASADFNVINSQTGFDSNNEVIATAEGEVRFNNVNELDVDNETEGETITGNNASDYNMGRGFVDTGFVFVVGTFLNNLNYNLLNYLHLFNSDFTAFNDLTGACSDNRAIAVLDENEIDIFNDNSLDLDNELFWVGSTGCNTSDFNIGEGMVYSGDAAVAFLTENSANGNLLEVYSGLNAVDFCAGNEATGFNSFNKAIAAAENEVDVYNKNDVDLDNDIFMALTTGGNSADFNIGRGRVFTGDAGAMVNVGNKNINKNLTRILLGAGHTALSAYNTLTGADSFNKSVAELENEVKVKNTNVADIDNDVESIVNTGGNSASYNLGCADILTGDALSTVVIENKNVNSNFTEVLAGAGNVELSAINLKTGFDSYNKAFVGMENEVKVRNENYADIDNDVENVANTGNNVADFNLAPTTIVTGGAQSQTVIQNQVNANYTSIASPNNVELNAANNLTGPGSSNSAVVSFENEINVSNTNCADIDNNVNNYTNTGNNSSSFNTGSGGVSTGGASVMIGIQNTANSNITE